MRISSVENQDEALYAEAESMSDESVNLMISYVQDMQKLAEERNVKLDLMSMMKIQ